jgi:hypothetical protein
MVSLSDIESFGGIDADTDFLLEEHMTINKGMIRLASK